MLENISFYNISSLLLLVIGIILHYILPASTQTLGDLMLVAAVFIHSSYLWGLPRTIVYALCAMIIGYFAELIGITTGWVFGAYHYNPANPGMIFGVPFFIPVMYVALLYAGNFLSIALSEKFLKKPNLWILSLMTGSVLTLKDVITDPLQSTIANVWTWDKGGSYFGVPIHNFMGWFFVFAFMTLVALSLSWHSKLYRKKVNLKITQEILVFPLFLFLTFILFGVTAAFNVPSTYRNIGNVSLFIAFIGFVPYFLLIWFNTFKKR